MNNRPVIYQPPATHLIEQYAKDVCTHLTQQGKVNYANPEVVSGLSEFLIFVTQLTAKYLNQGHHELLDNSYA